MTARTFLKSCAPVVAHYSGIGKALAFRYSGSGVIFMLHSTIGNSVPYLEDLRCPVAALEQHAVWLVDNDVQFVSLDQALERLTGRQAVNFVSLHLMMAMPTTCSRDASHGALCCALYGVCRHRHDDGRDRRLVVGPCRTGPQLRPHRIAGPQLPLRLRGSAE